MLLENRDVRMCLLWPMIYAHGGFSLNRIHMSPETLPFDATVLGISNEMIARPARKVSWWGGGCLPNTMLE